MLTDHPSFELFYKNIGKVYCPYFKDNIHFTELGFDHLQFKKKGKLRPAKDRSMRMRLLPYAIRTLDESHTLQNRTCRRRFERRYVNNRKELALTDVRYYEFVAIIEGKRLKVVIKEAADGRKLFLSVVPLFHQKMPPPEGDIL